MNLTIKQKNFADNWIETGNATQSYKKAGYRAKSDVIAASEGLKLLRNPKVAAYIQQRLAEIDSRRIADQTEVLAYLTSVLRGESRAEVVVVEGVGDGCSNATTMQKAPDERERLKAAELLGKRFGLFTDKINLEGVIPVVITDDDKIED